jgi:predicted lipid-binding transport protein (Tim44 family)
MRRRLDGRRRVVVVCALALLVGTAVLAGPLAGLAEARAGSGGFSGSRGSRSFSAPRSPAAPLAPAPAPSRPGTPGAAPAPARPGGLLGGLGGMLGGLLLGGLIGSLLFGGGFAGGVGLLEILVLGGLAFFVMSRLRNRQPAPAVASGYGAGAFPGTGPAAALPASGGAVVATPDDEDLARGADAIRVMDAGFDPATVARDAADLFRRLQVAWSRRDLGPVRAELTDELAAALEADLARLRAAGRINRLDRLDVRAADVTEAWQEYGQDFVTVRLRASAVDVTVDARTGALLEGDPATSVAFEEYWTLTRPVGPGAWRLSAIQQPPV